MFDLIRNEIYRLVSLRIDSECSKIESSLNNPPSPTETPTTNTPLVHPSRSSFLSRPERVQSVPTKDKDIGF